LTFHTALVTDSLAFEIAIGNWDSVIFAWQDTASHLYNIKPVPELLYAIEAHTPDMRNHKFRLAYRIEVSIVSPFHAAFAVYVNANDGSIIRIESLTRSCENDCGCWGTVASLYHGTQNIMLKKLPHL